MSFYATDETVATVIGDVPRRTFGWQLRLQLSGCDPEVVDNVHAVTAWVGMLIAEIGMKAYGDPIVDRFGEGDLEGITLVQRLTTSAVVLHCDPPDSAFIDVFSCRAFDPYAATRFSIGYFRATAAGGDFTERRAPVPGTRFAGFDFAAADRWRGHHPR